MALFGRDYDREYGYRYPGGDWSGGRSHWSRSRAPLDTSRWDRAYNRGYDWGMANRYGADYGWGAYDRGYKSRWETDYGDPFGDRINRTPMRIVHEGDRGNRGWENTYNREQGAAPYPFGYRPYRERAGYDFDHSRGWRDNRWF